jgi:hypothetical protein
MSRRSERRQVAKLCRQAEALPTSLHVASTFTLPQLPERVERHRARPVHLIPHRLPALAPHGLWVAGDHADYVFYDCAAGAVRRHQIIGHEFGHLLYDDGIAAGVDEVTAMLLPDVSPTIRSRWQGWSDHGPPRSESKATTSASVAIRAGRGAVGSKETR